MTTREDEKRKEYSQNNTKVLQDYKMPINVKELRSIQMFKTMPEGEPVWFVICYLEFPGKLFYSGLSGLGIYPMVVDAAIKLEIRMI
jgi:hypothetical protein